jgi:hypothetical protein
VSSKKGKKTLKIIAIILAVILVAFAFFFFIRLNTPMGTPPIYHIVNLKNLTLENSKYSVYNFTTQSGNQIYGSFNATEPIQVYIVNSANFVNWEKGQNITPIYSSGKVANAIFDHVSLPSSGIYYIIYDNTSGLKVVNVDSQVFLINFSV